MIKHSRLFFFICLLTACLGQFATDIYVPSLDRIAIDFDTTKHLTQWSMAAYLIAIALSLLIYGPLSEGWGRKKPFIIGLTIMIVGTCIAWRAPNINIFILGRFIQGCGAGAAAGLWMSIFRDIFRGKELIKYSAEISLFLMVSLSLAPFIGGYLHHFFGWRSTFVFILTYTVMMWLLVVFVYRETNVHRDTKKLKWRYIIRSYWTILSLPRFMNIALSNAISYGAYFVLFISTPILLLRHAGLSPLSFGWLISLGSGGAYVAAGFFNRLLVERWGIDAMLRIGWIIMLVSGLWMGWGSLESTISIEAIACPMILFFFGSTLLWPNLFSLAIAPFPKNAGYAGVTYRFLSLLGGGLIGGLIACLKEQTAFPLSSVLTLCSLTSWIIYERAKYKFS